MHTHSHYALHNCVYFTGLNFLSSSKIGFLNNFRLYTVLEILYALQLSEYQQRLSEAESEMSQLRSQLASLEESKEKLQQVLDECSSQERQSDNQIKLLQAQLNDKSERLSTAEDKIQVSI